MRSITIAMTWEFWHRSWFWILFAIIAITGVTTMIYGKIPPLDAKTQAKIHYITLLFEFGGIAQLLFWIQFF